MILAPGGGMAALQDAPGTPTGAATAFRDPL
jgi:hypothetical protein